jgi:hypothetical protein
MTNGIKDFYKSIPFLYFLGKKYFWWKHEHLFLKYTDEQFILKNWKSSKYKKNKPLNLTNPISYDEKLSSLMFRDTSPLKRFCSNKITSRQYVSSKGLGRILIKPFFVFQSTRQIQFSSFNFPVIIKTSHISGDSVILFPNKKISFWSFRALDEDLKHDYYHVNREINYKDTPRKIIVERFLYNADKSPLVDYKFFCFNGKVVFCSLDSGVLEKNGHHSESYHRNLLNPDFSYIPNAKETREPLSYLSLKKPINWADMVMCAEILSTDFNHVRIDLYSCDGLTYFGEMTFYHGAGLNDFEPPEFEKKISDLLVFSFDDRLPHI